MELNSLVDVAAREIKTFLPQTRKNHALEHATINLLEEKSGRCAYSGYSIHKGFWILGKATIQDVQEMVDLALARLKNGERDLAIHQSCGTNLAVSGTLTALGALAALSGTRNKKEQFSRFSSLVLVSGLMIQLSKPLGLFVQENVTTDPDLTGLSIRGIETGEIRGIPYFFIRTRLDN